MLDDPRDSDTYKKIRNKIWKEAEELAKHAEDIELPKPQDVFRLPYYAIFLSTEVLNENTKELIKSSNRLEKSSNEIKKLTKVLIILTIILAALAFADIIKTVTSI